MRNMGVRIPPWELIFNATSRVGEWKCKDCDKVFTVLQSYCGHRRKHSAYAKLRAKESCWNRGKTKEKDQRIKKYAETYSKKIESGEIVTWSKGLSKESDHRIARVAEKISATVSKKRDEGTWHNSFSRARQHSYANELFHGSWEIKTAMWFDKNHVVWERNKRQFDYVFLEKARKYTPDFFLPEHDCYLEVKGWKTSKDEAKWSQFPDRLLVLSGTDLVNLGIDIVVRKDWKN